MSEWYQIEENDIDIDHSKQEVNFFICNNDNGSVYLTLSFDQIFCIAEQMPNSRIAKNDGL